MSEQAFGSGPLDKIVEYFTYRHARKLAPRIEPRRAGLARELQLSRQQAEAAETLWSNGHAVEGLRLAKAALESAVALAEDYLRTPHEPGAEEGNEVASGSTESKWRASLGARGASSRVVREVEAGVIAARDLSVPELDQEIAPAHADAYAKMARARTHIDRAFDSATLGARTLAVRSAVRIAGWSVALLGVLFGIYLATKKPDVSAQASAWFASVEQFDADKALDGNPATSWLLPDGHPGDFTLRFASPKHIERLKVMNTANLPYGDSATERYRIEFFSGSEVKKTVEGAFEYTTSPTWTDLEAGVDGIDRIKISILSWHRLRGGIAELAWE